MTLPSVSVRDSTREIPWVTNGLSLRNFGVFNSSSITSSSLCSGDAIRLENVRAAREEANRACLLLQLPAELRNLIYEEVVPLGGESNRMTMEATRFFFRSCSPFYACRQLRKETLSMFCGSNIIQLPCTSGSLEPAGLMSVLDDEALSKVQNDRGHG